MSISDLWDNKEFVLFIIQILLFIVQVLSLGFLGIYVWKTWQMASSTKNSVESSEKMIGEMKETRDLESAPYVVPFININHHMMYFGIKNIGKTVAQEIKLEIKPDLKQYIGKEIMDISIIKNGVSSLPPGHEIGTMFAISHVYLKQADSPKKYFVKINYFGGLSKEKREHEQILDLSVYYDLIPDEDMQLSDIVKELANLSKNNQKISENLERINEIFVEGIWIKNPDVFMKNGIIGPNFWKSNALLKLNELKFILSWMLGESGEFPSKDTQIWMNSLTMQLSIISSHYSNNIKLNEKLVLFIMNITKFIGSNHFIYGRKLEGFDKNIETLKAAIDDLIKHFEDDS